MVVRDSVQLIERVGRKVDTLRLASPPGTIPIFDPSIGLYEVIAARSVAGIAHDDDGPGHHKDKVRLLIGADGRVRSAASGADAKDHFSVRATARRTQLK